MLQLGPIYELDPDNCCCNLMHITHHVCTSLLCTYCLGRVVPRARSQSVMARANVMNTPRRWPEHDRSCVMLESSTPPGASWGVGTRKSCLSGFFELRDTEM